MIFIFPAHAPLATVQRFRGQAGEEVRVPLAAVSRCPLSPTSPTSRLDDRLTGPATMALLHLYRTQEVH